MLPGIIFNQINMKDYGEQKILKKLNKETLTEEEKRARI